MTDPNGRKVDDVDDSGLDDAISHPGALNDDESGSPGTVLEGDTHLGFDTIVSRTHPPARSRLDLIQQAGDYHANTDGGDRDTGLDRFGRVLDQNPVDTSSGSSVDRRQLAYDDNGNVLSMGNLVGTAFDRTHKMAKPINLFSVVFLVLSALFSTNLRVSVPNKDMKIHNHVNTNGRSENIGCLPANSPGQEALHALLSKKKGKWRLSLVCAAPHFVLLEVDGFVYIDIHPGYIEVGGDDKHGRPISQRTNISREEYDDLIQAIIKAKQDG